MAFFDLTDVTRIQPAALNYNYGDTTLYYSDSSKLNITANTASFYYKIPVNIVSGTPNFSYGINDIPAGYNATNLYIFGLIHNNITDITTNNPNIIGELIVEHKSITNGTSNKLYACFLLSNPDPTSITTPTPNVVDKLHDMIKNKTPSNIDINLSDSIPKQDSCIIYTDKQTKDTVIVFLKPITLLKATADNISKNFETACPLFNISAPNNYVITTSSKTIGNSGSDTGNTSKATFDNNGDNEIYIDCNLTDPTDGREEINTYNVPINSYMSGQNQELNFMKTSVNFFIFAIGIIFIYFTVPQLYKIIVIDKVIKYVTGNNEDKITRVLSADLWITILFFVVIIAFFSIGFSENLYYLVTTGLFLSIFYGLSFSLIQVNKAEKDFTTIRGGNENIEYNSNDDKTYFNLSDMIKLFGLFVIYFLKISSPYYFAIGVVVMIILLCLYYVAHTIDRSNFIFWSKITYLVILPVSVPLLVWTTTNETVSL